MSPRVPLDVLTNSCSCALAVRNAQLTQQKGRKVTACHKRGQSPSVTIPFVSVGTAGDALNSINNKKSLLLLGGKSAQLISFNQKSNQMRAFG